jgi:hypothetical protein
MLQVMPFRRTIADAFPEIEFDETWIKGWFCFPHSLNIH